MESILSQQEFLLLRQFIEEQCGIAIAKDKAYLIESRLSPLLHKFGYHSYGELYNRLVLQDDSNLAEKVIDAITTNETLWFRDTTPWAILREEILPLQIEALRRGKKHRIRIWSAACSSGQEPYSIAMCIDDYLASKGVTDVTLSDFDIVASDISRTMLDTAKTGCYDNISVARGLSLEYREKYFTCQGRAWKVCDRIKDNVEFRHFNLQRDFTSLGTFDIVFCRYVTIYFSESLKRQIIDKISKVLNRDGIMFIGSSELLAGYEELFKANQHKMGVFYTLRSEDKHE